MSKDAENKTELDRALPKILEDDSWELDYHGIKYRLHEATIDELIAASAGAASAKAERIRLLGLVVQQPGKDGKLVPLEWPKKGADRLSTALDWSYGMGLAALEVQVLKSLKPLSGETSPTQKQEEQVRP